MPLRLQRGVARVTSVPQTRAEGRRAPTLSVVRDRVSFEVGDAVEAYAAACVYKAAEPASTAARKRVSRSRKKLEALPGGPEEVRRVNMALAFDGGRILRTARAADVSMRAFVQSTALLFVAYCRENDPHTTFGVGTYFSAAASKALAGTIEERLAALGDRVLTATRTTTKAGEDDGPGATTTLGLPAFAELVKLRHACLSDARLDYQAAGIAEAQARADGEGRPRDVEQPAIHPLLQERRRRTVVAATTVPSEAADVDEAPEDDDQAEDAPERDVEPASEDRAPVAPAIGHCGVSGRGCWCASEVAAGHCVCRCGPCGNPPPPPRPGDDVRRDAIRRAIAQRESDIASGEADPTARARVAGLRANLTLLRQQLEELS